MLQGRFILTQLFQLVLGKVADLKALTETKFSGHGEKFFADSFDKRGFACAVNPQNTDAFTGANGKFHAVENFFVAVSQSNRLGFNEMLGQAFGF